jgi:hypothetical protein
MVTIAAALTISTLVVLGLLHVYWAVGGSWGATVVIPEIRDAKAFHPGPVATLFVAALLLTAASLVALRAGVAPSAVVHCGFVAWVAAAGTWTVAVVFLARFVGDFRLVGVFKRVHGTAFARNDTRYYVPLCLALAVGCGIVALGR